jgi:hypothetical protein
LFFVPPLTLGVASRGSVSLGSCLSCSKNEKKCTFVLLESDSHGLCGPPMASSLTSYTEAYDVNAGDAHRVVLRPRPSRHLIDTPFFRVSYDNGGFTDISPSCKTSPARTIQTYGCWHGHDSLLMPRRFLRIYSPSNWSAISPV